MIRREGSLERLAWRQRPGVGRDSDPTTRKPLGLELPVPPAVECLSMPGRYGVVSHRIGEQGKTPPCSIVLSGPWLVSGNAVAPISIGLGLRSRARRYNPAAFCRRALPGRARV